MTDTILIVDDEDGVRRTMAEWLRESGLPVTVKAVGDAEGALTFASENPVDLAVLDWNLGTGADGLRLLEDLVEFRPNVVAILVTGFAAQATPLAALRMGVRDYLDKNADFTRDTFLTAVRKQLAVIAPAKRQRAVDGQLAAFREAVSQILPLVRGSAALTEPVSLPDAVRSLVRFAVRMTGAKDGAVVAYTTPTESEPRSVAYGADGERSSGPYPPFGRTLLAAAAAAGRPVVVTDFSAASLGPVDLLPVERNRQTLLLAPLAVGMNVHVGLELFDKEPFTDADKSVAAACAEIGTDLVRHIVSERQTSRVLFDAVEAALRTTQGPSGQAPGPAAVERLKQEFAAGDTGLDADESLALIDAIRALATRHGPRAVSHCTTIVTGVGELLDAATGAGS
jgi:two-component system nitrogen regulation response regulator NtrX